MRFVLPMGREAVGVIDFFVRSIDGNFKILVVALHTDTHTHAHKAFLQCFMSFFIASHPPPLCLHFQEPVQNGKGPPAMIKNPNASKIRV